MNCKSNRAFLIAVATAIFVCNGHAQNADLDRNSTASSTAVPNSRLDQFFGPAQPSTTLTIDLANGVEYQGDIGDPSKFARNTNITPSATPENFFVATLLADIVAVNGQPAKGLYVGRTRVIATSQTPTPGTAIADLTRVAIREQVFEILQADGTPIGTVMGFGFSGGLAPPGQPAAGLDSKTFGAERANWAIAGGTGAFLGARGQEEGTGTAFGSFRAASVAEDPAYRRINGGGTGRYILHILPITVPKIVDTEWGPAVYHSDLTLVSRFHPASPGESLVLFATGLGPVRGVGADVPFPDSPATVNSPIEVTVNAKPTEVISAVGYPGALNGYKVNFRLPADTARGTASIQVSAAWMRGTPASIWVR